MIDKLTQKAERLVNDFYISSDESHQSEVIINMIMHIPNLKVILNEIKKHDLETKGLEEAIEKIELIAIR